ncbi:GH39 family glycosyl hydrolase [Paenibacillus eucommiae]|uniref:Glycosyl hydrolases family 39 N-terminal catalytic domain-containing protein n=1 Tax=Paenibacillus eucommiae TaxID=1355755 RepID=A0ABS4IV81_9BACL|nr:hypothetical protein [Paenibacillus eucommiae]MBP1991497.1 hypothetical protein [Paenibacillus eucommiae]
MKKKLILLFCSVLVCFFSLVTSETLNKAYAAGNVTVSFDLSSDGQTLSNKFSDVNVWGYNDEWLDKATGQPANYFSTNYPFVEKVQLMAATGGCYDGFPGCSSFYPRDLFIDPSDTTNPADYDFSKLITALHHVVNQGLKPVIKTGNVPVKYSTNPTIGGMANNTKFPDDYDVYYNYIKALADELITEFGMNEVKSWSWGVGTEFENKDWFDDKISANTTKISYFKLYDYTVAALEAAYVQAGAAASDVIVGAHSLAFAAGYWNEEEFIDHVAGVGTYGVNYKTGLNGTQIDYLTASYYDSRPGVFYGGKTLADTINSLRNRANANGLTNLKYGIDEGRIFSGFDNKALYSRIVAHSFQASSDARLFKVMHDSNIDWFSTWGLSTEIFWGGVPSVGTHIANLAYKMAGDKRVEGIVSGSPGNSGNEINGIAGYNSSTDTMHFMVYNYNSNFNASTSETPAISISNIIPASGSTVTVKQWVVDDTHGNFWPQWWTDQTNRGLTDSSYSPNWSKYSLEVPKALKDPADLTYWYSRENAYKALATLSSTTSEVAVTGNSLTLNPEIAHHGVVFYEISNAKRATGPNLITNPGFEDDGAAVSSPVGWSTSGADADADYTEGVSGSGAPHTGSYKLGHWKGTDYKVYTYQTFSGLPNGLYTLKAWVKSDLGNLRTAYMEAKDYGGTSLKYTIPKTSVWKQISIENINVTNGQATIGFYSDSPANSWYMVDDVRFYANSASPTLPTPIHVGLDAPGASTETAAGNNFVATKAIAGQNVTATNLNLYVASGAVGKVRMALYSDNNGNPGTMLSESPEVTLTNGWNKGMIPSTTLTENTPYWLVFILSQMGSVLTYKPPVQYISYSYPASLPATAPVGLTSSGGTYAFYASN